MSALARRPFDKYQLDFTTGLKERYRSSPGGHVVRVFRNTVEVVRFRVRLAFQTLKVDVVRGKVVHAQLANYQRMSEALSIKHDTFLKCDL